MERKAWQGSVFDKSVTLRFKKLGDLGEYLAESLLAKAGFTQTVNLNKKITNTQYFDLTANCGGYSYAISVKARNRFENSTAGVKLNTRYKLTDDPILFEKEARNLYSSIPAWIAIAIDIDNNFYNAYFGRLQDLSGNRKGINTSTHKKNTIYDSFPVPCFPRSSKYEKIFCSFGPWR